MVFFLSIFPLFLFPHCTGHCTWLSNCQFSAFSSQLYVAVSPLPTAPGRLHGSKHSTDASRSTGAASAVLSGQYHDELLTYAIDNLNRLEEFDSADIARQIFSSDSIRMTRRKQLPVRHLAGGLARAGDAPADRRSAQPVDPHATAAGRLAARSDGGRAAQAAGRTAAGERPGPHGVLSFRRLRLAGGRVAAGRRSLGARRRLGRLGAGQSAFSIGRFATSNSKPTPPSGFRCFLGKRCCSDAAPPRSGRGFSSFWPGNWASTPRCSA